MGTDRALAASETLSRIAFALLYVGVFAWLLVVCEWNPLAATALFVPAMVVLIAAAPLLGFAVAALTLIATLAITAARGCGRIIRRCWA